MGADIHLYVEFARANAPVPYWSPVCGRSNPGRDYDLFAKIANVRGDGALFPIRGFPSDAGYTAESDNRLWVEDKETDAEGSCSRDNAERWIADGSSQWTDDRQKFVTHPDWHSHTWLTAPEWRQLLEAPRPDGWGMDARYWAVLAMMEELERREMLTRAVIWFDN